MPVVIRPSAPRCDAFAFFIAAEDRGWSESGEGREGERKGRGREGVQLFSENLWWFPVLCN